MMSATLGYPLRNKPDTRGLAYLTIAAVLNTLDEQGRRAVFDVLKEEFATAWPIDGDDQ